MALTEAVTVSGLLGDAGTIAGIVAALAAAVLAAVVLGQGREIRRLRDELDSEADRASSVEASLAAELAAARSVAAPAAVQHPADGGSVRSVPMAAAIAATAVATTGPETDSGPQLAAVDSSGMPSLGSATASPAIAAIASGQRLVHRAVQERPAAAPVQPAEPPRSAPIVIPAPAVASTPAASVGSAPLGGPSTAAAGGISRAPKPPIAESKRRSPLPRVLGGLALLAVLVFGVIWFAGSGDDTTSAPTDKALPTAPGKNGTGAIVAVLNGTPVSGLAGQVSRELVGDGFKAGRVATARDQQQSKTTVAYLPGHLTDAEAVAQSLGLKDAPVPADDPTQAIACPDPATCNVEVIVTVGSDRTR